METDAIVTVNLILGAASLVTSVTGFGYGLVAAPFMILILPPYAAVPVVLMSWLPLAAILTVDCFREMTLSRIGRLYVCALVGLPLGAYSLAHAADDTMRLFIGVVVLLGALTMLRHPGTALQRERLFTCAAGLLSGLMGGGSGITGPPIVLLGIKQQWPHEGFRADLIGYFLILHASMLVVFGDFGLVDRSTLVQSAWAMPGVFAGYFIGMRLRKLVSQATYRYVALGIVCAGGTLALIFR